MRQGCPLSPLLFNIYARELGMKLAQCKRGFKYLMVNKDGVIKEKSQAGCEIGEVEEYKYLGVTVKVGLNGGFKSLGDRMVDANGVLGMVNYAAARSRSKYVVGREGWKSMAVNRLMYGCRALAWYQHECDDLEI